MGLGHKWSAFRSWLYDVVIVAMTAIWYRSFLVRVPVNAHVLDIGIGTATSLLHNRDIVVSKRLQVVGTDIDADYVRAANENVVRCRLEEQVRIVCTPRYTGGPFDAIYFSGSFMIIPDKAKYLADMALMLRSKEHSRVYFSQTLEKPGAVGTFMEYFKPLLKWLTTIDFGTVTYRADFEKHVRTAGLEIEEVSVVKAGRFRDQVLVIAKVQQ
jgi:ubiquinone/menaquinone biosynthesis C-methylase UbiE